MNGKIIILVSFHYYVRIGHENIAKKLIDRKANVNLTDKDGFTPLHIALHTGFSDFFHLLSHFDSNFFSKINSKVNKTKCFVITNIFQANRISVSILLVIIPI